MCLNMFAWGSRHTLMSLHAGNPSVTEFHWNSHTQGVVAKQLKALMMYFLVVWLCHWTNSRLVAEMRPLNAHSRDVTLMCLECIESILSATWGVGISFPEHTPRHFKRCFSSGACLFSSKFRDNANVYSLSTHPTQKHTPSNKTLTAIQNNTTKT